MTHTQWLYYFAAELSSAVPFMPFSKALAFGRASHHGEEPEIVAREVATLLLAADLLRRSTGVRRPPLLH